MGNSMSNSSVFRVLLDQEAYEAGSYVSGNVCVSVHDSPATFKALYIKVNHRMLD